jgi:excinuclease ABC subunit B
VIIKGKELEQSIVREDDSAFDVGELIRQLEREMAEAAANLAYEKAALLRDQIRELRAGENPGSPLPPATKSTATESPAKGGRRRGGYTRRATSRAKSG